VLVVHDELVVEVDDGVAGEVAAIVEDGMLAAARRVLGDVPAVVDARVRSRWGSLPETVAAGGVAT
jgi:DNA polymerase I-like protein with 3'-5' exonuclease and polymerase domains